jgi:hypothetical protein
MPSAFLWLVLVSSALRAPAPVNLGVNNRFWPDSGEIIAGNRFNLLA